MVQLAVECGLPPLKALAMASSYPARYLEQRKLGAIAPGYHADFMILDDLTAFPPKAVYAGGQRVAEKGRLLVDLEPSSQALPAYPSLPVSISAAGLRVTEPGDNREVDLPVVALQNKRNTLTRLESARVALTDGYAAFEEGDNLALASIFARDDAAHFTGVIRNTGLAAGAIATTVAHDSHNLLVLGRDTASMLAAANRVCELGGGVVVAEGHDILATLLLDHFGLLSDAPVPNTASDLQAIEAALRRLGVDRARPFLTFSIMGLTVSPYAKFTDKGIIDTETRELVSMG
jgi:adenine deaminase